MVLQQYKWYMETNFLNKWACQTKNRKQKAAHSFPIQWVHIKESQVTTFMSTSSLLQLTPLYPLEVHVHCKTEAIHDWQYPT